MSSPQAPAEASLPAPNRDPLGAALCVVVGLLVLALSWFELSSIDLGYHLAYGRHFLDTGKIVEVDPFLYPRNTQPFINANWGSQVIIAWVERWLGVFGLAGLRLSLIAVVFACIYRMIRRGGHGLHWVAWAWLLAVMAGYERISLRPELFSYAVMSVMLLILSGGALTRRRIIGLALLQLLWVNLHSYFLIGLLLTGCFLAGHLISMMLAHLGGHKIADQTPLARQLAFAGLLQFAVVFVNPWFVQGAIFPIKTLEFLRTQQAMGGQTEGWSGDSPWSAISEFKSPFAFMDQPINGRTIRVYFVLLGISAVGSLALLGTRGFGAALATFVFIAMSLQMRRNIAQLAFVAAPLVAAAVASLVSRYIVPQRTRRWVHRTLMAVTLVYTIWTIYAVVEGRFYFSERRITRRFGSGYNDRIFPRAAVDFVAANEALEPRLYVNYFASSSTLPWLPARFKIFVDTNTFAYPQSVLTTAYKLGLGQEDHASVFADYGVNVALLHCGSDTQMLVRRLAVDPDWALVFFDRSSVIFAHRISAHESVIAAHGRWEKDLDAQAWINATTGSTSQRALSLALAAGVPISLGWHSSAIVLCEEAVRLVPDYYEVWQFLGVCHGNLGNESARAGAYDQAQSQYVKALECFEKVAELSSDPKDAIEYGKLTMKKMQEVDTLRRNEGFSSPALPDGR